MRLGILHLSDAHLQAGGGEFEERARAIKAAVQTRSTDLIAMLVVFSGDIAFSGKAQEYELARVFIDRLFEAIRDLSGITVFGPVIVPGNHDCNFEVEGDVRPQLLSSLPSRFEDLDLNGQTVEQLTNVQADFFDFERDYSKVERNKADRLYYSYSFQHQNKSVLLHCFNTAWVSRLKELQGQLLFPQSIQPVRPQTLPDLVVSVFHHPYAWLEATNGRQFLKFIESFSDIVLTGHEHEGDAYIRDSSSNAHVHYVEGSALQAPGAAEGFNFITADVKKMEYEVLRFLKKDGDSIYAPEPIQTTPFVRNPSLMKQYFENVPEFKKYLCALESAFSHPVKKALEVDDLFVYPDLSARSLLDKQDNMVSSLSVPDFIASHKYVMISGTPMSGKTTLAKKLYRDFQDRFKYVPLLVPSEDIRGHVGNALSAATQRAFREQYPREQLENFRQLDPSRKVLLIDNWNVLKFNKKGKARLLANAKKEFDIVVTLGTDVSWLQELVDLEGSDLADFRLCEIKEFGFRLRSQLITKWHTVGREFDLDEGEITHRISESEHVLDSVIGKSIVPSHPFYILYVLQINELDSQNPVAHGSYGHVYEALLTFRLASVSVKTSDLGGKFTYLSLIAYRLFHAQKKYLTPSDLKELHEEFDKEYALSKSQDTMLRELEEARILGRFGEDVGFLHKYSYYFFVAKYFQKALANNSEDQAIVAHLHIMADMVHDDEYMNILIFYIYLTEDRKLIEYILSNARKIFDEHQPCDLDKDVAFIANLQERHTMELDSQNVQNNKDEYLANKDSADQASKNAEVIVPERKKYDKSLAEVVKSDFAFKTLQVMGQVLRNFPGELRADLKLQLASESYALSLRTLNAFMRIIEGNVENLRIFVERYLLNYRAKPEHEVYKEAYQVIAYIAQAAVYGMIKKTSSAVGLEDLRETYEAVREQAGEFHIPTRLIDLAIRLDHFPKLPMADIEQLASYSSSNHVRYSILRALVADHLYLFPVDYKDRQKLAALLHFQTARILLAEKKIKQLTRKN